MMWTGVHTPNGDAVITMTLTREEADEILQDMRTGDDSSSASKLTFGALMFASDSKAIHGCDSE